MALRILRDAAANIREDGYFSIMLDETTDQSNREQVVIVLRHVDRELNLHEEFIGLYGAFYRCCYTDKCDSEFISEDEHFLE